MYGTLTEGRYANLFHDSGKARHGLDIGQYRGVVELATGDYVIFQGGSEARGEGSGVSGGMGGGVKGGWKETYKSMCVCSSD